MTQSLFRTEAVQARRHRLEGEVRLDAGLAGWVFTALLCAIVGAAALLLVQGEYPRRETVTGRLLPQGGLAHVRADASGRLVTLHAAVGDRVAAGAPLFTLTRDVGLASGADANRQVLAHLQQERAQTKRRLSLVADQMAERRRLLMARRDGLVAELAATQAQMDTQGDRVAIAAQRRDTLAALAVRGAATQTDAMRHEDMYLSALETVAASRALASRTRRTLAEPEADMDALSVEAAMQRAALAERLASLEQRLVEAESAGERVIRAPFDGVVGVVLAPLGDDLDAGAPVMTVLPHGALLQAELWVPSRAAGFLAPGQTVRMRYDAFPHQKFGVAHGTVTAVSKTAIPSQEVGGSAPMFRVIADLEAQDVTAYGAAVPLQAGMTLNADLVLEARTLWSLLLDPVRAAATR